MAQVKGMPEIGDYNCVETGQGNTLLFYQRMLDIIMNFKYLHNQFGCFNRNIQTDSFHKFIGFKNRLTRLRTDYLF
jgi:hypothetical protein